MPRLIQPYWSSNFSDGRVISLVQSKMLRNMQLGYMPIFSECRGGFPYLCSEHCRPVGSDRNSTAWCQHMPDLAQTSLDASQDFASRARCFVLCCCAFSTKKSKRSTQLTAKIITDLILCPLHKCSESKYFLRFYPNNEVHTFFRNAEICLRNLTASHSNASYLLLIATDVRSSYETEKRFL